MRPRLALIGPVLPFRGGIAQHTTMLHRGLAARAEVLTISFSRQYPAWLFPGASDKDSGFEGYHEPGVRYEIDSLNPLTWRAAVQSIVHFRAEGAIIPWWSAYWAFCFHHIAAALRRANVPVVFVCHNVVEHEDAAWKRTLAKWVLGTTDRYVVHDRQGARTLHESFPGSTVRLHPHPVHGHFPAALGTLPRRAPLELLFFGFVRPYKGLDLLLDALARLKDERIMLTVAGEFWSGLEGIRGRIAALGLADRIELRPRYHTEAETAELFARADLVVLPYRSATGSAVIPLAYHYGKPVIATDVGGLPDVVLDGRTGFIVKPEAAALASAIASMTSASAAAMRGDIAEYASRFTWDGFAATVLDAATAHR